MSNNKTKLYKYLSCSTGESKQRVLETIADSKIYLSNGENFNDPFDLLVYDRYNNTKEKISNLHILCLTNSYRNSLMWAHYADSHKGICITIEVPKDIVYPVCYSGKVVDKNDNINLLIERSQKSCKRNLQKDYNGLSFEKKVSLIKSQKWIYEKEYRILFDDSRGLIINNNDWYMSVKITALNLGVKFDNKMNYDLIELCQEKKIVVKKMALEHNRYALKSVEL